MPYNIITDLLEKHHETTNVAEIHGIATGMLCSDNETTAVQWLETSLTDRQLLTDQETSLLKSIFEQTQRLLADDSFRFDLLLPDDEESLAQRLEALRNWSLGFLLGIGYSSQSTEQWSTDSQEVLKDIIEISKCESDIEDNEQSETDYMEVCEYLRAVIFTLKDNLPISDD